MRRLRLFSAVALIAGGLAVSGCATTQSGLDPQTSQQWQAQVLAIAEGAEAGDVATALAELDALETDATQARADGEITAERAAIIQQSIALVRSDLEARVAEPATPVPEQSVVTDQPSTDTDSEDKGNSGNKNDNGKKNDDNGNNGNGNNGNGNNGKDDD